MKWQNTLCIAYYVKDVIFMKSIPVILIAICVIALHYASTLDYDNIFCLFLFHITSCLQYTYKNLMLISYRYWIHYNRSPLASMLLTKETILLKFFNIIKRILNIPSQLLGLTTNRLELEGLNRWCLISNSHTT